MNNQAMVRALKGAPISMLSLMLWCRIEHPDPVWTVEEFMAGTDYKRPAIAEARNVLIKLGLCEPGERGRIGLKLRDQNIRQIGLFDLALPPGEVIEQSEIRKSDLTFPTTTTAIISSALEETAVEAVEAGVRSEKLISLRPDPGAGIEEELLFALKRAGIGSNMWQELAALEWITAEYVTGHDRYRRSNRESVGLLITRLRCCDEIPANDTDTNSGPDVATEWERVIARQRP